MRSVRWGPVATSSLALAVKASLETVILRSAARAELAVSPYSQHPPNDLQKRAALFVSYFATSLDSERQEEVKAAAASTTVSRERKPQGFPK